MSIVRFNHTQIPFKQCYTTNYDEIVELFNVVHDKGINECAKVYCELINGFWDEDSLGTFKSDGFACVFEKYLACFSNPYRLEEYCTCHNPYSLHNQTEEEFRERFIRELYVERWLNDNETIVKIFMDHALEENEKLKAKSNI